METDMKQFVDKMRQAGYSNQYTIAMWHTLTDADKKNPVMAALVKINQPTRFSMSNISPIIKQKLVPDTGMEVVTSVWFSNVTGTSGIVLCRDVCTKQTKAYIGVGQGHSQEADEMHIAKWGSKVPKSVAEIYFGEQPDWRA